MGILSRLAKEVAKLPKKGRHEALETARRNAAKPKIEGGLGLGPDNTQEERAQALGFTTPAYHGTRHDFDAFKDLYGSARASSLVDAEMGHHFAKEPAIANVFTVDAESPGKGIPVADPDLARRLSGTPANLPPSGQFTEGGRVMPVLLRHDLPTLGIADQSDDTDAMMTEFYRRIFGQDEGNFVEWFKRAGEGNADLGAQVYRAVHGHGEMPAGAEMRFRSIDPDGRLSPDERLARYVAKISGPISSSYAAGGAGFTPSKVKSWKRDFAQSLADEGQGGFAYQNTHPSEGRYAQDRTSYLVPDARNVRSKFAAFDPARAHESDLLAGLMLPAVGGGAALAALTGTDDVSAADLRKATKGLPKRKGKWWDVEFEPGALK